MLQLGQKAKDKITGFEGIITARAQYLTGCDQYGITPPVNKEGTIDSVEFFDEGRIEITGRGMLPEEVQTETKGGPNRDAPRR